MLLRPCLALLLSCASVLAQAPDPELLQRYSEAGQRALAEHRYVEAEQAYEKLRELSPQTAEVHAGPDVQLVAHMQWLRRRRGDFLHANLALHRVGSGVDS